MTLSQRGDTLVEVLIAMAVVSSVLGAAYVSANRSLQASRASQERGEAIRIIESQAEQVKVFSSSSGGGGMFDIFNTFCIAMNGPNEGNKKVISGSTPECSQGFYQTSITYTAPSPAGSLNDYFTIRVQWNRVGGGIDEATNVYRLHS